MGIAAANPELLPHPFAPENCWKRPVLLGPRVQDEMEAEGCWEDNIRPLDMSLLADTNTHEHRHHHHHNQRQTVSGGSGRGFDMHQASTSAALPLDSIEKRLTGSVES